MRQAGRYILAAIVAGVLAVFLLWPIGRVIHRGFFDGGALSTWYIRQVFTDPTLREWLINAVRVAICATAVSLLLGVPLAVMADRVDFRGKSLASAMLLAPMILPPFVGAMAIQKLFAHELGSINLILERLGLAKIDFLHGDHTFWMVIVLEALHLYPIIYLNAASALANIDPAMAEAARNLGASRWRVLRRITLPLMRPGLFAGATIVFIWSLCELGTPLMLEYKSLLPVKIYDRLTVDTRVDAQTFAMVFVMLGSSVGLYAMGKVLFGRAAATPVGRANVSVSRRRAGWGATLGCWAAFGAVTFAAALPHIGVVLMAVSDTWRGTILPTGYTADHLLEVFRDPRTWGSIVNSLRYAGLSTAVCALLALAVSYLVVRLRIRGSSLLDSTSMLPLATPGLVMAAGYMAITARGTPLEALGPENNPFMLLVIAYTIRRLPYMVRSLSAGLQQIPETLEDAARNLGASRVAAVVRVTLPLVTANILAGGILAFSFNMLEVSDSLVLAQRSVDFPITKRLFQLAQGSEKELAAALGVYGMVLLGGTILLVNGLLGRRMGQLFRV
ncbi:MAG: iron ABC transporter permease [Planctomycetes bacterium]|nr:iron ABC transporter permease [Planctomycetota bacterium]